MAEVGTLCQGLHPRSAGSGLFVKLRQCSVTMIVIMIVNSVAKDKQCHNVCSNYFGKPVYVDSSDLVPLNMDIEVEKLAFEVEKDCIRAHAKNKIQQHKNTE